MGRKPEKTQQNRIVKAPAPLAQVRGRKAEERAAAWLATHGLKILARNVSCRGGELDLICLESGTLVFVEVRLRTNSRFGGAIESITPAKRRRIIFAAKCWLIGDGQAYQNHPCRFDVVLFGNTAEPQWIRSAFDEEAFPADAL
ncbi:MAG: YraN family protein [Azoarcus sp.]|nr:YraN family protein [Azoarcus sp.]